VRTRYRDLLLVVLTVSTGSVDAISWLGLGKVFSAFMTGNLVFLGVRAGGADGPSVSRVLAATVAFALGALIAGRLVRAVTMEGVVWPSRVTAALGLSLLVQCVFVALWAGVDGHPSDRTGDALIAASAISLGMQTAAVFALGVRAVFTTAATATLTVLMGDLSAWSQSSAERARLGAVLAGLIGGAAAGALLLDHLRLYAPIFPLVATGCVIAAAVRFPQKTA
jgi:uncharacterized membrane protein YoaK (UPF0700 family)